MMVRRKRRRGRVAVMVGWIGLVYALEGVGVVVVVEGVVVGSVVGKSMG